MLEYYKEQSAVERGFRFIKDKRFHVPEVYLKNENRIAALSMLMVLYLLIYTVAEWWFRKILKKQNATVMNPRKKADIQTFDKTGILFVQESQASLGPC